MTKGQIIKYLVNKYNAKKVRFKDHDASFVYNEEEYFIKVLRVNSNNQVTVNSTIIWEIKSGKLDGVRYVPTSKKLVNLKEFMKHKNKIIIFTEKPYRVLKCLNEADVLDVSDKNYVHKTYYLNSVEGIDAIL